MIKKAAKIRKVANESKDKLNLDGSMTKAGIHYSSLWSENVARDQMMARHKSKQIQVVYAPNKKQAHRACRIKAAMLAELGLEAGRAEVPQSKNQWGQGAFPDILRSLVDRLHRKVIMGVFDEGCIGMFNAIIPDALHSALLRLDADGGAAEFFAPSKSSQ